MSKHHCGSDETCGLEPYSEGECSCDCGRCVDWNQICEEEREEAKVIRLVPNPKARNREYQIKSMVKALKFALEKAENGELDVLAIVGRQSDGGVLAAVSHPCDEVHVMGLASVLQAQMIARMRRGQ